jgi:hypothetical protein
MAIKTPNVTAGLNRERNHLINRRGGWGQPAGRVTPELKDWGTKWRYKWRYNTPTRGYVLQRSKGRLSVYDAVEGVEPPNGFEPLTCCLRNSCSATELRWPASRVAQMLARPACANIHCTDAIATRK